MAIGFGATDGVGSTDRLDTGLIGQSAQRTFAFRCKYNGNGGGGFGRAISTDSLTEFISAGLGGGIGYGRLWSSTGYQWVLPGTGVAGTIYSVVISYDSSNVANDVIAWVNGAAVTVGVPAARTGTPNTDANSYKIGNRGDNLRNWDGWISSVAIWNEMIPSNMALLISSNYSPLIWLSNLTYYSPMIRDSIDIAGGRTQTVTGTAAQPHPPVLRERGGGFTQINNLARTKRQRIIFEGSSTIAGYGLADTRSQSFPAQAGVLLGSGWESLNFGVSGSGFTQLVNTSPARTHWMRDSTKSQDVVFSFAGGNDIEAGLTGAQLWTLTQTWTNAIKARGFRVILSTLFAQNRGATFETERNNYNTLMRAGWSAIADGLADFASDSIIGNSANTGNTSFYQADGWHLTERGVKDCLLPYFRIAIKDSNSLNSLNFSRPENSMYFPVVL